MRFWDFLFKVLRARWIVHVPDGDFGLRILGTNLYYYKSSRPLITRDKMWRKIHRGEFGHSMRLGGSRELH